MSIGIVGMGYVGLPLAVGFAEAGVDVIGVDVDQTKVAALQRRPLAHRGHPGRAPRRGARALHVHDALRRAARGRGDPRLRPDPADAQPRARPRPAAERLARAGGRDRQGPARRARVHDLPRHDTGTPRSAARGVGPAGRRGLQPRVLTGARRSRAAPTTRCATRRRSSAASRRRAPSARSSSTAASATPSCPVSTPEVAELSKLLENIFRSVNIALVNEMAMLADRMGIDIWEVIDAAATKPFGFTRFDPGPGMGGHCLPVDPFYLTWKAREYDMSTEFIELAGKVNQNMPYFCLEKIERALNDEGKAVTGREDPGARRRLQGRHERHARVAGAEDRRPAASTAAPRSATTTRSCPRSRGTGCAASPLDESRRLRPRGHRHRAPGRRPRGDRAARRDARPARRDAEAECDERETTLTLHLRRPAPTARATNRTYSVSKRSRVKRSSNTRLAATPAAITRFGSWTSSTSRSTISSPLRTFHPAPTSRASRAASPSSDMIVIRGLPAARNPNVREDTARVAPSPSDSVTTATSDAPTRRAKSILR